MAGDLTRIGRALISVSDKSGLIELGAALAGRGVELVSTGGTARALGKLAHPRQGLRRIAGTVPVVGHHRRGDTQDPLYRCDNIGRVRVVVR